MEQSEQMSTNVNLTLLVGPCWLFPGLAQCVGASEIPIRKPVPRSNLPRHSNVFWGPLTGFCGTLDRLHLKPWVEIKASATIASLGLHPENRGRGRQTRGVCNSIGTSLYHMIALSRCYHYIGLPLIRCFFHQYCSFSPVCYMAYCGSNAAQRKLVRWRPDVRCAQ